MEITSKQIGYISYLVKNLRRDDPEVRKLLPDNIKVINGNKVNFVQSDLEDSILHISKNEAMEIIDLLLSDNYLEGIKRLPICKR